MRKTTLLSIEKFPFLALSVECDKVTTPYPISALLFVKWSLMGSEKEKEILKF